MFKALHTIITLVIGYNFKTTLTVHNFHSQRSIPCRDAYHGITGKYIPSISFASYRVHIYTPWSRAAMWINWFAEGQKCQAIWGSNPGSQHESQVNTPVFHSTSNIPRHTCSRFVLFTQGNSLLGLGSYQGCQFSGKSLNSGPGNLFSGHMFQVLWVQIEQF